MSGPVHGGRLPAQVGSFVDRRHELAEVKRLLATANLVTLTGTGGSGKTRLALRVAGASRRAYPDGVWHVDVGALADGALLGYAVADALGLSDQTGRPAVRVLIEYLYDRRVLLVLDGCDHLLDACRALVGDLLREVPHARVLCTSRQRLDLPDEHTFAVPPMPVPDPDRPHVPGAVTRYAALALFAARAAAAAPGFELTPANQAAAVRICAALDGLPLAIELAAAQLRMLSTEQVEAGLADRFRLLAARYATPERHRSLEATFDWSYGLCSPAERDLWGRLAVFAGSFDDDAVRYLCGDGAGALAGLLAKSVLTRTAPGRYELLDTVREYGLGRLRASGVDEPALRRRHRDHYRRVAERAAADWFGADQEGTFHRLRAEQANLRAALDFCMATPGEAPAGLAMAAALWFLWTSCGYLAEGQHWLERGLDLTADGRPAPAAPDRAAATWALAAIVVAQGDQARVGSLAAQCLADAERIGDRYLAAATRHVLATAAMWTGEPGRARSMLAESAAAYAAIGVVDSNVLMNHAQLALATALSGDLDTAQEQAHRVRAECADRGERWALAWALHVLAVIAGDRGELAAAAGYARDCLGIHQVFHNVTGMALVVELLAALDPSARRTAALHGISDQLWRALGRRYFGSPYLAAAHRDTENRARARLGDPGYRDAFRFGAAPPIDDAVGYALGSDPPPARPPGDDAEPGAAGGLSPREREVAELLAEGLSNRELAARLGTSRRTAETHVQNILRKLGFTARAQIAKWMTENRS